MTQRSDAYGDMLEQEPHPDGARLSLMIAKATYLFRNGRSCPWVASPRNQGVGGG